jgi:hypothetical protein
MLTRTASPAASALVIRLQLLPQPAGLEPDNGVVLGIVSGGFPEGLEANGVLFQPVGVSGNGLLGQVLKQAAVNLRGFEGLAVDQTADLRANVLRFNAHRMLMLTPLPTALLTVARHQVIP